MNVPGKYKCCIIVVVVVIVVFVVAAVFNLLPMEIVFVAANDPKAKDLKLESESHDARR